MSDPGHRAVRNSRAPYFLVAAVCVVIVVAAILSNWYRGDSAQTDAPATVADDGAPPRMGSPPARNDNTSIAERSAEMTTSMQGRRAERKQKLQDARLATANRYAQEAVDPLWAAGKETRLQALAESPTFEQVGVVPDSLEIDCRSTLCRITASHASYGASADWGMIFMTSSAAEIKRAFTKTINNPDGTTSVEIYAQAR